ncbi:GNAT family N-acetyltransferase [Streptomyces sp. NPDC059785]|uniref:GNAT family N-acetyltransferase n=1 Tax=Streptomyces sp. NPDC059785 TaxID=3346945 RepID=UPI0036559D00
MDIVIRRARPGEYEAVGEVTARAYLGDGLLDFGESDTYLTELRDVAKRAAAAEVLVAVDGAAGTSPGTADGILGPGTVDGTLGPGTADGILGGVTFVATGGPMADIAREGEAEIRMLAVAAESRGRGAGEALVRACVERARATEGCVRVVLSSQRTMRAAHRIYERLGFRRTPERDWNPLPELDDIVLITYELTL